MNLNNILKEAKWIKSSEQDWMEKEVRNPATGRKVKIKSLPKEERAKYKPKKEKNIPEPEHQNKLDALKNSLDNPDDAHQHVYTPSENASHSSVSHDHIWDDGAPHLKYFDRTGRDWEGSKKGEHDEIDFKKGKSYHMVMTDSHAYIPDHNEEDKWHRIDKDDIDEDDLKRKKK